MFEWRVVKLHLGRLHVSAIRNVLASAALACLGTIVIAAAPDSSGTLHGTAMAASKLSYVCMTDDGYGRRRPCDAGYKASNPNWRAGDNCFTDDGYGRYRPCSAGYKAKHAK
jgi:hypothetical protein